MKNVIFVFVAMWLNACIQMPEPPPRYKLEVRIVEKHDYWLSTNKMIVKIISPAKYRGLTRAYHTENPKEWNTFGIGDTVTLQNMGVYDYYIRRINR